MAELKILLSAIGGDLVSNAFDTAAKKVSQFADETVSQARRSRDASAELKQAFEKLQDAWRPSDIAAEAVDRYAKPFLVALEPLNLFEAGVSAVADGMATMAGAVYDVGTKFDRLQVQMDAMWGSDGMGDRALAWAQEFESKVPQDVEEVTQRMIALKRQGFDPLADGGKMMQALGDAAQATGMSFDRLLDPLAKMNTTGLVDFKSLTAIAKEGIPVFEMLEEKTGLTAKQIKAMGADAMDGREALDMLTEALGDRYAGAMERATKTAEVGLTKIGDLGEDAAKRIADAGAWESFTETVLATKDAIGEVLDTVEFDRFAKSVSNVFTSASEQVELFVDTAKRGLPTVLDLTATTLEGLGALTSTRKNSMLDFLTGEDIVAKSEKEVADFEKRYLQFMQNAREAKDAAKLGEVITEADVEGNVGRLEKTQEAIEAGQKDIDKYFQKLIAEEKKTVDEREKLAKKAADMEEAIREKSMDRARELQKEALRDEMAAEEERMSKVKDALENRVRLEELFWDRRKELADTQFKREQDAEDRALRRRQ
ncbi:MAG: hypothetical protein GX442_23600 [Candidatus Riflebacteria bacterium]|nr:hypothetical protein [Candidatus Riflebacteria bacterium]